MHVHLAYKTLVCCANCDVNPARIYTSNRICQHIYPTQADRPGPATEIVQSQSEHASVRLRFAISIDCISLLPAIGQVFVVWIPIDCTRYAVSVHC